MCAGCDVCVGLEVCVWADAVLVAEGSEDCSREGADDGSGLEADVRVGVGDGLPSDSGSFWFDRSRSESSSTDTCGRLVEP